MHSNRTSRHHKDGKSGVSRASRIFPITIETPFGAVHMAYRVGRDGKPGKVFPYMAQGENSQLAAFLQDMTLEDAISDLWWTTLPELEKTRLLADELGLVVGPYPL